MLSNLVRIRTTMEINRKPIVFCVIIGNLIISYAINTVLHIFILQNKIDQIKVCRS